MTSELSNALNPRAAQPRARTRQRQNEAGGQVSTSGAHQDGGQRTGHGYVPHRSELELAIIPQEQPQTPVRTPAVTNRQALNTVQELLQAVVSQNAAIQAEQVHRTTWEHEQEAKQNQREVELQSQLDEMRSEILLLKATVSMQTQSGQPLISEPLPDPFQPRLPEPAAYIEEITSPMMQEQRVPQIQSSQTSPTPAYLVPPLPTFVQGSSSTPFPSPGTSDGSMYNLSPHDTRNSMLPSPTLTEPQAFSPLPPPHAQPHLSLNSPAESAASPMQYLQQPTSLPSPAQSTVSYASPVLSNARPQTPTARTSAKRRTPPSPASDYSSEDSDEGSTSGKSGMSRIRKNGHDRRCLTIQHAMRVHLLKSLRIRSSEPLPESYDGSSPIPANGPVRFVWEKTVKKCPHNAAMKTRVLKDLVARRKRYKDVPDKDFEKKVLDTAFEQAFTTLRQKYKMQKDDSSAIQYKRREDQKYLKTRRKERKKAKLTTRTDRRAKLDIFAHPTFDPALNPDCMSSEESCDEYVEEEYPTGERHRVQIFNIRGPMWRSSRLLRFYTILDAEDAAEQEQMQLLNSGTGSSSTAIKPRKLPSRKERRLGPPKDGFTMPPRGVASWMVSRRWIRENCVARPDFEGLLGELVQESDGPGFDWDAFDLLGGESEVEVEEQEEEQFIPRSDTSSLAHALAPPM